jgi:hypothetical protein
MHNDFSHWKGKLIEIPIPKKHTTWSLKISYLISKGYFFDKLNYQNEHFNFEQSTCINIGNKWYSFDDRDEIETEDLICECDFSEEDCRGNKTIEFEFKFNSRDTNLEELLNHHVKGLQNGR